MRFASTTLGFTEPLAPKWPSSFSATSRPNRPFFNVQTSVVWCRRFRNPRRNPEGSLIFMPNPTVERVLMTKEDYLKYYRVPTRPLEFFTVGKVFNVLNVEKTRLNEGDLVEKASSNPQNYSEVLYGETAYSAIYSYVVVDELKGRNACLCCRRHTYSGRGVGSKSPILQNDHIMLHSGDFIPPKHPAEIHMTRDPLRVWTKPGFGLGESDRLDLKLIHTVDYDQRVCEVGDVTNTDVLKLLQYREDIHKRGEEGRVASTKGIVKRILSPHNQYFR